MLIRDLNPNAGWNSNCLTNSIGPNCLNPRLNPNRGDITAVTESRRGPLTANSLQANLSTRTLVVQGNSLTFTAAYTYSHMIDMASDIFGPNARTCFPK